VKVVDTHAHVNFAAFKDDAATVMKRAHDAGIGVVNVGTQYSTSARAVKMAHEYGEAWAAIGVHPVHLRKGSFSYADSEELEPIEIHTRGEVFEYEKYLELAKDEKVVAIGEVGLDYHHFEETDDVEEFKARQKETLIEHIKIANEVGKPVMIHCWDAYPDLLAILTENPVKKTGVIHSFVGGYKTARKFVELGYAIGVNGIATYSDTYKRLIREIGLEHIVLETDCPYLAPGKKKGERNEPANVVIVAEFIAETLEIPLETILKETTMNAERLFNLR